MSACVAIISWDFLYCLLNLHQPERIFLRDNFNLGESAQRFLHFRCYHSAIGKDQLSHSIRVSQCRLPDMISIGLAINSSLMLRLCADLDIRHKAKSWAAQILHFLTKLLAQHRPDKWETFGFSNFAALMSRRFISFWTFLCYFCWKSWLSSQGWHLKS